MRIWSLHPALLDRVGLVSAWREGLLAQAVLRGGTRGYRHHPQLDRFRTLADPVGAIDTYLDVLAAEADGRGYRFDRGRLLQQSDPELRMSVASGQLDFEFAHLRLKVGSRQPDWLPRVDAPRPHPLFEVVDGPLESWERSRPAESA